VEREAMGLDVFVGTAAVADYRPATRSSRKLKKTSERIDLPLECTADILAAVAARADRPFVVGFAAETHDVEQYARSKLLANKLDLIAANEVGEGKVFDRDDNALVLLWADGRLELGPASKDEVARRLLEIIGWRLAESRARGAHNLGSAGAEA